MKIITAPELYNGSIDVFLAGGISGCPHWQKDALSLFKDTDLIIANPRRDGVFAKDTDDAAIQIEWEHNMLERAKTIFFWFPKETLCPITLFELGVHIGKNKNVIVGTHPEYARRFDLIHQLQLAGYERPFDNIEDTVKETIKSQ